MDSPAKLKPLALSCSSTACVLGQHYYGPIKRKWSKYPVGECRDCGIQLVDWTRVQQRSVADVEYTINMLMTECWRHEWWHREFDAKALKHAARKGRLGLASAIEATLRRKAFSPGNPFDGQQTRSSGNVISYAQHATGTCCRKCMQYWHGVPQSEPLTAEQRHYFARLIDRYIGLRLPDPTSPVWHSGDLELGEDRL
jgi:hypothetical protein